MDFFNTSFSTLGVTEKIMITIFWFYQPVCLTQSPPVEIFTIANQSLMQDHLGNWEWHWKLPVLVMTCRRTILEHTKTRKDDVVTEILLLRHVWDDEK